MEKEEIYNHIKGKKDITIKWDRRNGVLEKRCFVSHNESRSKLSLYLASGREIKPEEIGYENIISIT